MKITSVGFTGTQNGMSELQKLRLYEILYAGKWHAFHHGDCVGADTEAHEIAGVADAYIIVIHPPDNDSKRAFCEIGEGDIMLEPKPYLDRNKDIVDACDVLIACPFSSIEELRSGTWSTVRYARKKGKPVILIYPSGVVNDEQGVLK